MSGLANLAHSTHLVTFVTYLSMFTMWFVTWNQIDKFEKKYFYLE